MSVILLILSLLLGIALLAYVLGNYTFWLPYRSDKLPRVIMFHQVTPHEPVSGMNMHPAKFEQFLKLLIKKDYVFGFVSELSPTHDQKKCIALTFDDGFIDNYIYAFPMLKKYNIKATIYLATQIQDIEKLNEQQIKEMHESGLVEFGAHTQHHTNLLKISDDVALAEIKQSKEDVEKLIGQCKSFAFPFGRFSKKHEEMVRELGFVNAVSTRKKVEAITIHNQYCIPRISTHGSMNCLQMRIALAKGRYKL